jgi:hypothetical protein
MTDPYRAATPVITPATCHPDQQAVLDLGDGRTLCAVCFREWTRHRAQTLRL